MRKGIASCGGALALTALLQGFAGCGDEQQSATLDLEATLSSCAAQACSETPAGGASYVILAGDERYRDGSLDKTGHAHLELPPGSYRAVVTAGGAAERDAPGGDITLAPGEHGELSIVLDD